jgi:MtN3 and saliva related transmembrane protein
MPFLTEAIGTLAAILTTASFLPQAIKTMKSGNTKDISLLMYVCFVTGVFLWTVFGILINTMIIVVANVITFILAGTILVIKIRNYKKDKSSL